jgi:hypothetical protein
MKKTKTIDPSSRDDPQHGFSLIILDYRQFDVDSQARIRRGRDEAARIRVALTGFLSP